jgi:hypothetical protein
MDDALVTQGICVLTTPGWLQHGEWMDRERLAVWAMDQVSSKPGML